eukprot:4686301-Pyramimonas_sp.AAC.1
MLATASTRPGAPGISSTSGARERASPSPRQKGGWYGPARVLAQEKRHVHGRARPTSGIWIAYGNVLI